MGGLHNIESLKSLLSETAPHVHGESWIKGYKANNDVIYEGTNFSFYNIAAVIVGGGVGSGGC